MRVKDVNVFELTPGLADALSASLDASYLEYFTADCSGTSTKEAERRIAAIPEEKRYLTRVLDSLDSAFADFDTETAMLDLPHMQNRKPEAIKRYLEFRLRQFKMLLISQLKVYIERIPPSRASFKFQASTSLRTDHQRFNPNFGRPVGSTTTRLHGSPSVPLPTATPCSTPRPTSPTPRRSSSPADPGRDADSASRDHQRQQQHAAARTSTTTTTTRRRQQQQPAPTAGPRPAGRPPASAQRASLRAGASSEGPTT